MKSKLMPYKSLITLLLLSVSFVFAGQTWAQSSALDNKKAVLVSKFIKNVKWPDRAIKKEFIIGVYEDVELYSFFSNYFADKAINNKNIVVSLIDSIGQSKNVNLLYVPDEKGRDFDKLASKTSGSYVLLVSENTKRPINSMINLVFNQEKTKIEIKINYANTKREKLGIPATSVFLDSANDNNILSLSAKAIKENQLNKELTALKKYVLQQKKQLTSLNSKLKGNEEKLTKYNLALKQQTAKLKTVEDKASKQQKSLTNSTRKLEAMTKDLAAKNKQLKMTKDEWLGAEAEKSAKQEAQIKDLTDNLDKQQKQAKSQASKLAKITKEKEQLSSYSSLFYVAIVLALVAFGIAGVFWSRNKNAANDIAVANKAKDDVQKLLGTREQQLVKSENVAALGYIASDVTFAAGTSAEDALEHSVASKDLKNIETLKPAVALLENYNQIAADQDENEKQSFDIVEYTKKIVSLFSVEFESTDIEFICAGENKLAINSIPGQIALVLINVINNSIKHGFDNKGNGKISILIEKSAKDGAKITFQDNGAGMDKSTQEKVFTPFFTTKPERGYLGLGMSTVSDVIKTKLSGDIKLQSQQGKGTTLTITL